MSCTRDAGEPGRLAQLVRASALQAEGHPFEPGTAHQEAVGRRQSAVGRKRLAAGSTVLFLVCLLPTAFCLLGLSGDVVQLVRTHACHA